MASVPLIGAYCIPWRVVCAFRKDEWQGTVPAGPGPKMLKRASRSSRDADALSVVRRCLVSKRSWVGRVKSPLAWCRMDIDGGDGPSFRAAGSRANLRMGARSGRRRREESEMDMGYRVGSRVWDQPGPVVLEAS